jgi:hypothetical protein
MTRIRIFFLFLCLPLAAFAHVGSPDIYYEDYAGPYHLLVTVRPPLVIPGLAEIEVRSVANDVTQVLIAPSRLIGPGAKVAPRPDVAVRSSSDPQVFTGKLWIMARGSWKVEVDAEGPNGKGELAVPIAAMSVPISATMQKPLGGLLAGMGLLLLVGLVGIIRAANSGATLDPGVVAGASQKRRAFITTVVAAVLLASAVAVGDFWWRAEAAGSEKLSYKLPHLQLLLNGDVLQITLQNPNNAEWRPHRSEVEDPDRLRLDDLIPDHGHLMHLFLVRVPDMRSFWHLHPRQLSGAEFSQVLPSLPPGHYRAFADIVHHTGFPETQVGEIDLPTISSAPPTGDDAGSGDLSESSDIAQLSDGNRMVWEHDSAPLKAGQPTWFRFRIEDKNGNPASDVQNYMGMRGHAAFIRDDGQVFAHVHPSGSVSMAAAELAQGNGSISGSEMATMNHPSSSEVSFPYGFSQPGNYRIFVQIKSGNKIETGSFTASAGK